MEIKINQKGIVKNGKYEGYECEIEYNKEEDIYFLSLTKDNERTEIAFVTKEDLEEFLSFEIEWII